MKLYFMVVKRVPPVPSPVLAGVYRILRRRGFTVQSGIAEELLLSPEEINLRHDLYILKSHTELSKSLAGILFSQGARLLNPYPACVFTQDKIVAARILAGAGVPAPRSWVTGDFTLLRPIAAKTPLIIKPYLGHRGAGLRVVRHPDELAKLPPPQSPVLIQEFFPGSGEDLKVYVVGRRVFVTRKRFSANSFTRPGRLIPLSGNLEAIARRCGEAFGLGLYGIDVIETPRGPVVVDLNFFPGYKGIPGIAPFIAQYIEDYAHGRESLAPPQAEAAVQWNTHRCALESLAAEQGLKRYAG